MKALGQFEGFWEGLVEGSFRRLFRGRLEPVDLARRLARVMDDTKRVTWQQPLVPNQYQISLAPGDFSDVESFVGSLENELAKYAAERAAERGYTMLAPAQVILAADTSLQSGNFHVVATVVDAVKRVTAGDAPESPPPMLEEYGQTRPMRPVDMPLGPTGVDRIELVGQVGGQHMRWAITGIRMTIGRGLDNDIVLDDASVSRHHAELVRQGIQTEVHDLGSTNGTWVNAGRVQVGVLHLGDQLAFGAVQVEVARSAAR